MFTLFKKKKSHLQTFGLIFTAAVGVVLFWRGVWGLLDLYFFPNNPLLSYLFSILMGLIILWFDDGEFNELDHRF